VCETSVLHNHFGVIYSMSILELLETPESSVVSLWIMNICLLYCWVYSKSRQGTRYLDIDTSAWDASETSAIRWRQNLKKQQ